MKRTIIERGSFGWRLWVMWIIVSCSADISVAFGQVEPLLYRRILVPQDELNSQIRGLLPMERDDFEQKLKQISERVGTANPAAARIDEAVYRARLEGDQLIRGTASLGVVAGV
jgi:hypothetical protein